MHPADQAPASDTGTPGFASSRAHRLPGPGKTVRWALLCLAVLSTSGCVFLRLLELKNQLGKFDENFSVDREVGLTFTFLHPVLLEQDMWLLGLPPTTRKPTRDGVIWTLVFEKLHPDHAPGPSEFDLSVTLGFVEGKLARFHLGEEYFTLIPKDAVLMTIRSLGQLKVDAVGRRAVLDIEESDEPGWDFRAPTKPDIAATLGMPWLEQAADDGGSILEYRYRLVPPSSVSAPDHPGEPGREYLLRIVFSRTDDILNVSGRLPLVGSINISYE